MKKIILLTILSNICLSVFSQDGPKVVVFNSQEETKKEPVIYQNLVKLSVLEAFSGDLSLYYERILKPNLSGEVGLGITLDDYLTVAFDNTSINSSDRTALMGTSFGLGLRYYPFRASEDFYFAPEYKFRYYHNTYNPNGSTSGSIDVFEEKKTISNFRMTVGYVYFFDDKIFIDYFAGIGVGVVKNSYYDSVYDGNTQTYNYELISTSQPRPRLTLGVKFGFAF